MFNFASNYKVTINFFGWYKQKKKKYFISGYIYISVQLYMVNNAASGLYGTPPCTHNYMMKGNMAYEDRKIRANKMGTQTTGIEDKKALWHNFKMYTNVTALKRGTNSPEKLYWQQSK